MIVYGDAVRELSAGEAIEHVRREIDRALASQPSAEATRRVLIHAGEIEQAVGDSPHGACGHVVDDCAPCAGARAVTDAAADAFERIACGGAIPQPRTGRRASEDLLRARRAVAALEVHLPPEGTVRVRIPEGFAFYGLLPDLYRMPALRWAEEESGTPDAGVLVAGVRSIGTTLSAVVGAVLRARGFRVERRTVRPEGHPFARRAEGRLPAAPRGIVVDEGPGLSGSSMLAVADLLVRSGVRSVALFPGHGAGPGAAATASTRRRWRALRCHVPDPLQSCADGRDLVGTLWSGIDALHGDEPATCEDLGGGAWRAILYDDRSRWPFSPRALERPKLLVTGQSGRRVLFKFSGLATSARGRGSMAETLCRRLHALARTGSVAAPLGVALGFVAHEWIEGVPCSATDASPEVLERLGAHLVESARGPLPPREADEARLRLLDMVRVNVGEALGIEASRAAVDLAEACACLPCGTPGAGDGRMAPHEWIRTPEGRLVKTDAGGHDLDHTWVGRQPLPWDVAGTLLEWDLHGEQAARFLDVLERRSGVAGSYALHGYLVAYAAHRMGQSRFFAETQVDPVERGIQERAFRLWRDALQRVLLEREERRGMVA